MRKCDSIFTTTTFIITASLSLTLMSGYGSNQQNAPMTTVASTTLPAIANDNNPISKK